MSDITVFAGSNTRGEYRMTLLDNGDFTVTSPYPPTCNTFTRKHILRWAADVSCRDRDIWVDMARAVVDMFPEDVTLECLANL